MFVRRTGSSWGGRVDGYCDRLSPVSIWSLRSLRSLRKKSSAIIWKPLSSDRSDNDRWDRTFCISAIVVAAIAGEWFHMIAMITTMVAIIWKPGFNLIMAYFKRKDCLQRNLYLNCVLYHHEKALKASDIVWSVSISAVVWSSVLISVTWVELLWLFISFSE